MERYFRSEASIARPSINRCFKFSSELLGRGAEIMHGQHASPSRPLEFAQDVYPEPDPTGCIVVSRYFTSSVWFSAISQHQRSENGLTFNSCNKSCNLPPCTSIHPSYHSIRPYSALPPLAPSQHNIVSSHHHHPGWTLARQFLRPSA